VTRLQLMLVLYFLLTTLLMSCRVTCARAQFRLIYNWHLCIAPVTTAARDQGKSELGDSQSSTEKMIFQVKRGHIR